MAIHVGVGVVSLVSSGLCLAIGLPIIGIGEETIGAAQGLSGKISNDPEALIGIQAIAVGGVGLIGAVAQAVGTVFSLIGLLFFGLGVFTLSASLNVDPLLVGGISAVSIGAVIGAAWKGYKWYNQRAEGAV